MGKKKKKSKSATASDEAAPTAEPQTQSAIQEEKQKEKRALLEALYGAKALDAVNDKDATVEQLQDLHKHKSHKFWDTMPMPSFDASAPEVVESGPLEVNKLEDVRKVPLNLPPGYEWYEFDLTD